MQPEVTAVTANTRLLEAAEGGLVVALQGVDAHVARAQATCDVPRAAGVTGEDVAVQAVVAVVGDGDYGLYSYVFSKDTARAWGVAQRLRSGNVGINTLQRNHEAPFGGFKQSGVGRDGGDFGLHAYSEMQSIVWPS